MDIDIAKDIIKTTEKNILYEINGRILNLDNLFDDLILEIDEIENKKQDKDYDECDEEDEISYIRAIIDDFVYQLHCFDFELNKLDTLIDIWILVNK